MWGAEGEERFPLSGKPPQWRGDQLGQRGSFGGLNESAAFGLWQAGQSKTYTDGTCCNPACPSLSHVSAGAEGGMGAGTWGLESGPRTGTAVGCLET